MWKQIAAVVVCLVIALPVCGADWPQFRGVKRDGTSEETGLLRAWPKDGPAVAWKAEGLGAGYSSLAVAGGKVYTMGTIEDREHVIAMEESSGKILWKTNISDTAAYRNGQGDGPRATPTVDGDRVYVESGSGDIACLECESGKIVWVKSLVKDFGGAVPGWGYSESPLVIGKGLIVTPGGDKGAVVALNKMNAEVVWRSKDQTQRAHYVSPQVAEINGVKQIVQMGATSVFGLDLLTGKALWEFKRANNATANCAMPIVFADHVFASSAYGTGAALYAVMPDGSGHKVAERYTEKKMDNHHGGIVMVGDEIYGFGHGGLICMNLATGHINWTDKSVSKGSLIAADGMLYCLGEGHELALVEVNKDKYVEHGRFKLPEHGKPSWAHPVVANGKLFIRDQETVTAYVVK